MGEVGCLKDGCFQNLQVEGNMTALTDLEVTGSFSLSQPIQTVTAADIDVANLPSHGNYDNDASISLDSTIVEARNNADNQQIYLPAPSSAPLGKVYIISTTSTGGTHHAVKLASKGDGTNVSHINHQGVTDGDGNLTKEVEIPEKASVLVVRTGPHNWSVTGGDTATNAAAPTAGGGAA
jgi:hypothetical protein